MQPTISETVATHVARDGRWLRFRTRRALWIWLRTNEPECLDIAAGPAVEPDDSIVCCYCNHSVEDEPVPPASADADWLRLAAKHGAPCEWISTRAHQSMEVIS